MGEKIKIIRAETCSPEDNCLIIAKLMSKKNQRRVFVLGKNKKLAGVVTTTDFLTKIAAKNLNSKNVKIKDIMSKKVFSIETKDNIDDALKIMNKLKTFVCPITENGKFLGIITYQNLISHIVKQTRAK